MAKLMLAYGSNLNKRQMRMRCPSARSMGTVMLQDAILVFRGVADVAYAPGHECPCGLWLIQQQDEWALDGYEGVRYNAKGEHCGMYYKEYIDIKRHGRWRKALVYVMLSDGIYPPSQHYVDIIRRGYADFGLDDEFLNKAIKMSFDKKEPDDQTTERRARQKADGKQHQLATVPETVARKRLDLQASKHSLVDDGLKRNQYYDINQRRIVTVAPKPEGFDKPQQRRSVSQPKNLDRDRSGGTSHTILCSNCYRLKPFCICPYKNSTLIKAGARQ